MAKTHSDPHSEVQGEGDHEAGRRYNEATREFVEHNDVTGVARDAEPQNAAEQEELEQAERKGRLRAKDEDPLLDRPEDIKRDGPR